MTRVRRPRGEEGETLLELIIAIMILGVCVVAVGTGLVLTVKMSNIHRQQAVASDYLHNYAELVQSASYQSCSSGTPNYASGLPTPAGFNTPTATVKYWNGSAFALSGCPGTDPGLQQITFSLASKDNFVTESLVTVIRSTS
jgi:type II secretory pathway pseudopilin PulG